MRLPVCLSVCVCLRLCFRVRVCVCVCLCAWLLLLLLVLLLLLLLLALACLLLLPMLADPPPLSLLPPTLAPLHNREKQRKRQQAAAAATATATNSNSNNSGADAGKPDRLHLQTINLLCCLLLALPYDCPPFIPPLVSSLVQHADTTAAPGLGDVVRRAVLDFKRTHQDRWAEFKAVFTAEQLADLAGASAISYLS